MISTSHDLPPRGNYFAEGSYLTQDLGAGTLQNRAGARMVALTDDFLVAMLNTLERELGAGADEVVKATGRDWGRRAAEQFAAEMQKYRGRALLQLPLAMFAADLAEAFRHHGWGAFRFDFSHYALGVLTVEVRSPIIGGVVKPTAPPADALLGAFLAGMVSHFAGIELDCVQTKCPTIGVSGFVLTAPERLKAVRPGGPHDEIIAELTRQ